MFRVAQGFQCRPSTLLSLDNAYVAYCFDEALYLWGNFVENELAEAELEPQRKRDRKQLQAERRRKAAVSRVLGLAPTTNRFRDPQELVDKANR